ncbi:MAG: AAA family ATPase, partial [Okeania sp. SIO3C4]|nr:AAA family ATPase [Okeania sp. SIO3C4]
MLKAVRLHNFKSHPETNLEFDDSQLHALVGPNSSGKTSVLQALHYMIGITQQYKDSFPFNYNFVKDVFQYENSPEFITTIGENQMSVTLSGVLGDNLRENWELTYKSKQINNSTWSPILLSDKRLNRQRSLILSALKEYWRYSVYLKLVAANLAKAAYSDAVTPQIEFDGSGLAPNLDYLRNEAPDKFQSLQEMLQQVVPGV